MVGPERPPAGSADADLPGEQPPEQPEGPPDAAGFANNRAYWVYGFGGGKEDYLTLEWPDAQLGKFLDYTLDVIFLCTREDATCVALKGVGAATELGLKDGIPYFRAASGKIFLCAEEGLRMRAGSWVHLCATYHNSILRLYVDGFQIIAQEAPGQPLACGSFVLGREMPGAVRSVRVFGRALAREEVARYVVRSTRSVEDGPDLVSFLELDKPDPCDATGKYALRPSGNCGPTAALHAYVPGPGEALELAAGLDEGAEAYSLYVRLFLGRGEAEQASQAGRIDQTDQTDQTDQPGGAADADPAPARALLSAPGLELALRGGVLCARLGEATLPGPRLAAGRWHDVLLSCGPERAQLFVDGASAAEGASASWPGGPLALGGGPSADSPLGSAVTLVACFSRALGEGDARAFVENQPFVYEEGLAALYGFDTGEALDALRLRAVPNASAPCKFMLGVTEEKNLPSYKFRIMGPRDIKNSRDLKDATIVITGIATFFSVYDILVDSVALAACADTLAQSIVDRPECRALIKAGQSADEQTYYKFIISFTGEELCLILARCAPRIDVFCPPIGTPGTVFGASLDQLPQSHLLITHTFNSSRTRAICEFLFMKLIAYFTIAPEWNQSSKEDADEEFRLAGGGGRGPGMLDIPVGALVAAAIAKLAELSTKAKSLQALAALAGLAAVYLLELTRTIIEDFQTIESTVHLTGVSLSTVDSVGRAIIRGDVVHLKGYNSLVPGIIPVVYEGSLWANSHEGYARPVAFDYSRTHEIELKVSYKLTKTFLCIKRYTLELVGVVNDENCPIERVRMQINIRSNYSAWSHTTIVTGMKRQNDSLERYFCKATGSMLWTLTLSKESYTYKDETTIPIHVYSIPRVPEFDMPVKNYSPVTVYWENMLDILVTLSDELRSSTLLPTPRNVFDKLYAFPYFEYCSDANGHLTLDPDKSSRFDLSTFCGYYNEFLKKNVRGIAAASSVAAEVAVVPERFPLRCDTYSILYGYFCQAFAFSRVEMATLRNLKKKDDQPRKLKTKLVISPAENPQPKTRNFWYHAVSAVIVPDTTRLKYSDSCVRAADQPTIALYDLQLFGDPAARSGQVPMENDGSYCYRVFESTVKEENQTPYLQEVISDVSQLMVQNDFIHVVQLELEDNPGQPEVADAE